MNTLNPKIMHKDYLCNLPRELISEIFLYCLPSRGYLRPDAQLAPLLLSHVCSSWRAFTQTIPKLWSSLHIELEAPGLSDTCIDCRDMDGMNISNEQIIHWGRLSSPNQPFDLRLSLKNPTDRHGVPHAVAGFWKPVVELVVRTHASHLRNLILDGEDYESCTPFLKLHGAQVPMLEALHIHVLGDDSDYDELSSAQLDAVQVTTLAPCLRKVFLDYVGPSDRLIPLPWAQLAFLLVDSGISDQNFHFLLSACPQLETLSVQLNNWEKNHALPANICGKSLQNLDVTFWADRAAPQPTFFWSANFPALLNLTLRDDIGGNQIQWEPQSRARDHLFRQLRHLQTLKLSYQNMSTNLLLDLLRSTPALAELAVDCQWQTDSSNPFHYPSFLEALTCKPHQEVVLPLLTVLELYVEIPTYRPRESNFPFTASNFVSMVKLRCKSSVTMCGAMANITVPLRRFILYTQHVPDSALNVDEVLRGLKTLRESGEIEGMEGTIRISNDTDYWLPRLLDTWDS